MFLPIVPTTGLTGFQSLEETKSDQIERLREDPETARDIEYFRENIGAIRNPSDLVADRRLLEVALTAFGLETEIDKTAFIERALEDGVDDESDFANRLNDPRWVDFVSAFSFGDPNAAYEISPFQAAVELKLRPRLTPEPTVDPLKVDAARVGVSQINSIDDLLADRDVLDVALAAFGLDGSIYTDTHYITLISQGTDSINDYARNQENSAWVEFTDVFEGLAPGDSVAQLSAGAFELDLAFQRRAVATFSNLEAENSPVRISRDDVDYFRDTIGSVTDVDAFLADDRLKKTALVTFGLVEEGLSDAELRAMIEGAVAGDFSAAEAQSNFEWTNFSRTIARAINGETLGSVQYRLELQIAGSGIDRVPQAPDVPRVDADDLAYFQEQIGSVSSGADLVSDERLLNVALTAFGLDDENKSAALIQDIVNADLNDPNSFVFLLNNERWVEFARAFNPPTDGGVSPALMQYEIERRLEEQGAPAEDIEYIRANFSTFVTSNLDIVLTDELRDITLSAFGIEKDAFLNSFVLNMILSDPSDDRSFVRQFGDPRWVDFSETLGSFAGANGQASRASFQEEVVSQYLERSFEISVGGVDQDLRLALNFAREIEAIATSPDVDDAGWFQILGSEPLRRVVDRAFGLPSEFVQLEIETQRITYEARALSLFGSESAAFLADPENVVTVLTRFLADSGGAAGANTPGFGAIQLLQQTSSFARSGGLF